MKKTIILALVLIIALSFTAWAQDSGIYLLTTLVSDSRIDFSGGLLFNQETANLAFENQASDDFFGKLSLSFRYINNPVSMTSLSTVLQPQDLFILPSIYPLEIGLDQAYFTVSNFLFNGLDLTIGKQRINWGTADGLNPTDTLNPLDLSDPLNFGKKSASVAVNAVWTFADDAAYIQLVGEPFSQPARLNPLMTSAINAQMISAVEGIASGFSCPTINYPATMSETYLAPELNIKNALGGIKIGGTLAGFDMSTSFVTRLSDMPYMKEMSITGAANPGVDLTVSNYSYIMDYYREYIVGADIVKDLGFVLAWAEASLTFQEDVTLTSHINVSPAPASNTVTTVLSAEPYLKYTVGMSQQIDFFYFNFQYCHGFAHERGNTGPGRLQDYAILRLEFNTLSDKLKFFLTGAGNLCNLYDAIASPDFGVYVMDNYGVMGEAGFEFMPILGLSLKTGVMFFDGKDTSNIGQMRDNDFVYLRFEGKF
ncbi:MAG: hypothetical protein JW969_08215 [Spirochaetales bacterium]|nr:hypothetical protein [Spirochaetales bacterium]